MNSKQITKQKGPAFVRIKIIKTMLNHRGSGHHLDADADWLADEDVDEMLRRNLSDPKRRVNEETKQRMTDGNCGIFIDAAVTILWKEKFAFLPKAFSNSRIGLGTCDKIVSMFLP